MTIERYNDTLFKIEADHGKFIINQDTGFKCLLTLDTEENTSKYTDVDEDPGTLAQEVWGNGLIRTYSRSRLYLIQNETGIKYSEAIDVPNHYTYRESDEEIPEEPKIKELKEEVKDEPTED